MHQPPSCLSVNMSNGNISTTPPLPRSSVYLFPSSNFPLIAHGSGWKEGLKESSHVYRHSPGSVRPPSCSHWQVSPLAETVLDSIDTSHGCQGPPESNAYNRYPQQSTVLDPLFKPRQAQWEPSPPYPDVNRYDEVLLNGSPGRQLLTRDPPSSAVSFLAPGGCSPLLSQRSGTVLISGGRQFSGSPPNNLPVADRPPCWRSHQDRRHRDAWVPPFSCVALPVGANRYRDNDVQPIISYGLEESRRQVSYQPRPIPPSGPVHQPCSTKQPIISSSGPSAAYASKVHTTSSPLQATAQSQSQATNVQERPGEKKYPCTISGCKKVFTQPQVRNRHIKDFHEEQETCSYCCSKPPFTFSRGRPYIYRKHVKRHHPEIPLPKVRQRASIYAKESYVLGPKHAHSANYVHPLPLTKHAPLYNTSYYPWFPR